MIRVLMDAGQAKTGDVIEVAGLQYRIVDVEHYESGRVSILARRPDDIMAEVTLWTDPDAPFAIVAPDQDGQS